MWGVLMPHQIARYDELRGHGAGAGRQHRQSP
jgi:hypothetical protein